MIHRLVLKDENRRTLFNAAECIAASSLPPLSHESEGREVERSRTSV